ncbi:MAG: pseudouridylate synthase [Chitinophagaceae bacterium]|nr:pseudouridylate synthase [Oligoflexus sp.]
MTLDILLDNASILAINKPAGILVHRSKTSSRTEPALLQIVRDYCGQRVFAPHRLDRATSGVLIFAKSAESARFLSEQFQSRTLQKTYLAVVRGWPSAEHIDYPLARLDNGHVQDAQTELKLLETLTLPIPCDRYEQSRYALVSLRPHTGRRHQLRRHMKHIHHPIIGDTCYGHGPHNRLFREHFNCTRLLLHHQELTFKMENGQRMTLKATLDESFQKVTGLFSH